MTYTHLIAITQPVSDLHFKEYLDIALVSASYDSTCAVFIANTAALPHVDENNPTLAQSFNMLAEFDVPLFSEHSISVYQQALSACDLADLTAISKHCLIF